MQFIAAALLKYFRPRGDDDFVDRLNYYYTTILVRAPAGACRHLQETREERPADRPAVGGGDGEAVRRAAAAVLDTDAVHAQHGAVHRELLLDTEHLLGAHARAHTRRPPIARRFTHSEPTLVSPLTHPYITLSSPLHHLACT